LSSTPLVRRESAEQPAPVNRSQPTIAPDSSAATHEPGSLSEPAGGSDPAAESPRRSPPAAGAAPEGATPAAGPADVPSEQALPLAAAGPAAQPAAPAPRRVSAAAPPAVTARYVAVLDDASGELLHGQDEHARVAPASITKIAT